MIVKNNSKAVIVLNAIGLPALRLFPGYNTVKENEIEKYFEGNPAATGHKKISLSIVDGGELTAEDKAMADKAEEKNELLNKAQRVIQANTKELSKNNKTIVEQEKLISDQSELIKTMQSKIEEIEKSMTKPDKKFGKGKGKKDKDETEIEDKK